MFIPGRKYIILIVIGLFIESLILISSCKSDDKHKADAFLNLDFEIIGENNKPTDWFCDGIGYTVNLDGNNAYHGKYGLSIKKYGDGNFAGAGQFLPVNLVKGKHVTVSGYIKTLNVSNGYACFWLRIDSNQTTIKKVDMSEKGVKGTTIWKRYIVEMDIDRGADAVCFGALLNGDGTAWFDSLNVYIDGVALTKEICKVFIPNADELNELKKNTIELKSVNPNDDFSDLQGLNPFFKDAEIVALGEGTHGTSEFFKMKHRLIKFMASQNKNITFAFEANLPECRAINEYIHSGVGNAKVLLKGLYFWTWDTQEVLDMIEWMKNYNLSKQGNIDFYGFDMQTPTVALKNIVQFVKKYEPEYLDSVKIIEKTICESYENIMRRYFNPDKISVSKWKEDSDNLYNHLIKNQKVYSKIVDSTTIKNLIKDADIIVQGASMFANGLSGRDYYMAENVKWIKENFAAKTKLILWAHNGHVSKMRDKMGGFLAKEYSTKLFSIGFTYYDGSYTTYGKKGLTAYSTDLPEEGSIESILNSLGKQYLFLSLKNSSSNSSWLNNQIKMRSVGARQSNNPFYPLILPENFDGLIYIEKSTPTKLL